MKLRGIFYNILVGVPGGFLIFMGMLMFNAVLSKLILTGPWAMLVILCVTSLVVGMLARLMRPFHGLATAIASGVIAALIILYLRLASPTGAGEVVPVPARGMGLVFGPAGMLVTVGFSILGAWIIPYLRKRTGKQTKNISENYAPGGVSAAGEGGESNLRIDSK